MDWGWPWTWLLEVLGRPVLSWVWRAVSSWWGRGRGWDGTRRGTRPALLKDLLDGE